MKALFKLFVIAFLLGGWALAASALQVVRSPGSCPMGRLSLMPKDHLSFKHTWVDTTRWSAAELAAHPRIMERLKASGCSSCTPAQPAETASAR